MKFSEGTIEEQIANGVWMAFKLTIWFVIALTIFMFFYV